MSTHVTSFEKKIKYSTDTGYKAIVDFDSCEIKLYLYDMYGNDEFMFLKYMVLEVEILSIVITNVYCISFNSFGNCFCYTSLNDIQEFTEMSIDILKTIFPTYTSVEYFNTMIFEERKKQMKELILRTIFTISKSLPSNIIQLIIKYMIPNWYYYKHDEVEFCNKIVKTYKGFTLHDYAMLFFSSI